MLVRSHREELAAQKPAAPDYDSPHLVHPPLDTLHLCWPVASGSPVAQRHYSLLLIALMHLPVVLFLLGLLLIDLLSIVLIVQSSCSETPGWFCRPSC